MIRTLICVILLGAICLTGCWAVPMAAAGEDAVFLREEFLDLKRWKPLTFPKIQKHSVYSVVRQGDEGYLMAESDDSASGLIYEETFDVYKYPRIRWRWKADRVYERGDAGHKSGDDYPMRIYVVFPYDPSSAGFRERIKYGAAKALYGEYPPASALNYIWANRNHTETIIPNAYTGKAMMIVKRGPGEVGTWQTDEADIREDYRRAFGEEPPSRASLAIMNDSDDTGERSVSYIEFLEIFR